MPFFQINLRDNQVPETILEEIFNVYFTNQDINLKSEDEKEKLIAQHSKLYRGSTLGNRSSLSVVNDRKVNEMLKTLNTSLFILSHFDV